MKQSGWTLLLALTLLHPGCTQSGPGSNNGDKPSQVESGLRFPVQLKGEPAQPMRLAGRMTHYNVPGVSIAVIHNYEIEWAKGYGVSQAGRKNPVDDTTLFQAASISKPVAATAALRLVEQGSLGLDDTVNSKLASWKIPENEFTSQQAVLLRHLMSHNGGLTVHGFPGYAPGDKLPTVTDILDGKSPANTSEVRVDKEPGTGFRYSGGGYTIMQLLMEDATGKPFHDLMKELVLEPAGMSSSTYEQPLPGLRETDAASAHDTDGNMIPGKWHIYPERAAAGLWTTPTDLARYAIEIMQAHQGESSSLLSPETARQMLTREAGNYGLGLALSGEGNAFQFSHGGSNAGFRCFLIALPETGQGVAIMTNAARGGDLAQEIVRSVAAAYNWPGEWVKKLEVTEVDSKKLEGFQGQYQIEKGPSISVTLENGQLYAQVQGNNFQFYPAGGNRFIARETNLELEFVQEAGGAFEVILHVSLLQFRAKKVK